MLRITELRLPLNHSDSALRSAVLAKLEISADALITLSIARRAADARKRSKISLIYSVDVTVTDEAKVLHRFKDDRHVGPTPKSTYHHVAQAPAQLRTRPVVIGTGPCGLFAGLILAEMGFNPIILERGKIVRERTVDTFALWRKGKLSPESNAQFGEGGAGTFSDGKLYSRIKDPMHRARKVLTEFVAAGAPDEILYVAKPHIGTFRLVSMVESMRAKMESLGAEIRFQSKVESIDLETHGTERRVVGVTLADGSTITTPHVVLAVGHSARDTFQMLFDQGIYVESKPFSIGVRIEHPQSMIDRCMYGPSAGNAILGAADYQLVHHCSNGRAVYSFCMCPGGTVVAATSEIGRVVTNGMSQYSRAERNANSGLVVDVTPERDFPGDALAGIAFQREWESRAFVVGGSTYNAPGQLVGDFLAARPSTAFGSVIPSYKPGVHLTDLAACLPDYAITAMREALPAFDRKIKGYAMADAVMTGVETRTSAPLRIKRDETTLQSINTTGLYPAGEGAGYAGGILSAAVDGIKVAEALARAATGVG